MPSSVQKGVISMEQKRSKEWKAEVKATRKAQDGVNARLEASRI